MATVEDVLLPDIGDFAEVEIIEILVAPGDRIEPEQSLLTLESDKATMEIPAPKGGTVKELKVSVGDKISKDALLMTIETEDAGAASAPAPAPVPEAAVSEPEPPPAAASADAPVPAEQAAPAEQREIEVRLPDVGDFADVPVIEVLVGVGDSVAVDQSILTLESDKATMEIPSSAAGTVRSVAVKVGDKVNQGDLLLTLLGTADGERAAAAAHAEIAPSAEEAEAAAAPAATPKPGAGERAPGESEH